MSEIPSDTPRSADSAEDASASQWRAVYEGCEAGLRAFLRGRLSQESDVDDCLQVVYVKMIQQSRKSGQNIVPAARRAWLFRVAANESARMWRSKAATDRMLQRQGAGKSDAIQEADATEKIILTETTDKVRQALTRLPDSWREIVELRIQQNLTFQQIANRLDIPLGTALTRMRRALERLRNDIQADDET